MVADGETLSVQVRVGTVDRLTKAREKRLGLRVFIGKRSATTSTSDFSRESLERLVADTCTLARAVVEDDVSGLPDAALMAVEQPSLDLYDETVLDTETQIDWAKRGEAAAFAADPRITNSEGAEFDSSSGRVVLANSHGFVGSYKSSNFSLSVSPIATESETGAMQRDAWYEVQRKFARLASAESIGQEAARRAVRRLGARKVATKRVPVVFDQETAGSLLANLCSAISGYGLYKRASFLLDQLGQTIASDLMTLYDDGRMIGGLGSRPFDGEGLATRKENLAHPVPITSSEGQAAADAFFRMSARRFVTGRGVAEAASGLRVGSRVDLKGLGPLFSGKYAVTSVRHRFDTAHGIRTEFEVERPGIGRAG